MEKYVKAISLSATLVVLILMSAFLVAFYYMVAWLVLMLVIMLGSTVGYLMVKTDRTKKILWGIMTGSILFFSVSAVLLFWIFSHLGC